MILRFVVDLGVPFTNNQSERDVRSAKIQQRTSGGCWFKRDYLSGEPPPPLFWLPITLRYVCSPPRAGSAVVGRGVLTSLN
jgi:transposase IS66 family protein